ncbi:hypothetical protein [Rufibacter tibetensis]|nr:hypothetical protein [Rufibacter tibetensis]
MGQKWIEVVKNGSRAYSQGEYSKASGLFTQMLAEIKKTCGRLIFFP